MIFFHPKNYMKKLLKSLILAIPFALIYFVKTYGALVRTLFKRDLVYEIFSRLIDENDKRTQRILHNNLTG